MCSTYCTTSCGRLISGIRRGTGLFHLTCFSRTAATSAFNRCTYPTPKLDAVWPWNRSNAIGGVNSSYSPSAQAGEHGEVIMENNLHFQENTQIPHILLWVTFLGYTATAMGHSSCGRASWHFVHAYISPYTGI